jgi:nitroreductase
MDLFETIQYRRSVRAYRAQPVEPEKLQAVLQAANQAPSAGNLQAYRMLLVRDETSKRSLARAALDQGFLTQAPVVLVFCTDPRRSRRRYGERGETLYALQDATIAAAYAQLVATALGLATCWVGAFDEPAVSKILHLPEELRPVILLPLGYPAENPPSNARRPIEEMLIAGR